MYGWALADGCVGGWVGSGGHDKEIFAHLREKDER